MPMALFRCIMQSRGSDFVYRIRICAAFEQFRDEVESAVVSCDDNVFDGFVLVVF